MSVFVPSLALHYAYVAFHFLLSIQLSPISWIALDRMVVTDTYSGSQCPEMINQSVCLAE